MNIYRAILLFVAVSAPTGPLVGQTISDPALSVTPYLSGLSLPTGFQFTGANEGFVIQKDGVVMRFDNGLQTEVLDLNVATDNFERGLLGIEVDPDFATNNLVYLYYTAGTGNADGGAWTANRVSQFTYDSGSDSLGNEVILGTFGTSTDGQAIGPNHNGGPLRFGPDGKLYGITGDLNRSMAEQNNETQAASSALTGGIYRLNTDGSVPADNPFVANTNTDFHRWYAYGVRNSFGIAFDPVTGNLWQTENGPGSHDEINLVAPGFNGGWTDVMGPGSPATPVNLGASSTYSEPEFSFLTPIAITSIEFLVNSNLDGYEDAVLVGDSNTGSLYLFRLNDTRTAFELSGGLADGVADSAAERSQLVFGSSWGTVTDIQVGPDGSVYIASLTTGAIYQVVPEPGTVTLLIAAALALAFHFRRRRRTF